MSAIGGLVDPSDMNQASDPRHLVIVAHPSPDSFCHAVAKTYATEVQALHQQVRIHDLYATGFDPVLHEPERRPLEHHDPRIAAELAALAESTVIVLVYPIWFGGPPAMLKGYVDRVLGASGGYLRLREGGVKPQLHGRYLFSILTSGTPLEWLEEYGQCLALRQGFDIYVERSAGLRDAGHLNLDEIGPHMSVARSKRAVGEVAAAARRTCGMVAAAEPDPMPV